MLINWLSFPPLLLLDGEPADALILPADRREIFALLEAGCVVMRACALRVRVVQAVDGISLLVVAVPADALAFPALRLEPVTLRHTRRVVMIARIRVVHTVDRRVRCLR